MFKAQISETPLSSLPASAYIYAKLHGQGQQQSCEQVLYIASSAVGGPYCSPAPVLSRSLLPDISLLLPPFHFRLCSSGVCYLAGRPVSGICLTASVATWKRFH